jgi:hypothetical protein
MEVDSLVGRSPDRLTPVERTRLAGKWIALELYRPQTLPLRRIEAVGESAADCAKQLTGRGLDPRNYEFTMLFPPW